MSKVLENIQTKGGKMSNRSVRDGVILVGGFHFFMAVLCLVAVSAIFVFSVLPPIETGTAAMTQDLFLPVLGIILGIIISAVYAFIGIGLIQLKNSARMTAIFMGALGIFGGFIGVMSSIATNIIGQSAPDWLSIVLVGLATICVYSLISFMNIFILIFLFNQKVRSVFYGEEWVAAAEEASEQPLKALRNLRKGPQPPSEDESRPVSSLADLKN
jgi:hypothetical protein